MAYLHGKYITCNICECCINRLNVFFCLMETQHNIRTYVVLHPRSTINAFIFISVSLSLARSFAPTTPSTMHDTKSHSCCFSVLLREYIQKVSAAISCVFVPSLFAENLQSNTNLNRPREEKRIRHLHSYPCVFVLDGMPVPLAD